MAPNYSQATDVPDIEHLIIKLSPKVFKTVRQFYRYPTNQCEIEDIAQDPPANYSRKKSRCNLVYAATSRRKGKL